MHDNAVYYSLLLFFNIIFQDDLRQGQTKSPQTEFLPNAGTKIYKKILIKQL